jgi:hypothetical protein
MALQTKGLMTPNIWISETYISTFDRSPGGGIGPSLGVYLYRTTQKTSIPRVRIRTAEMYVGAVEDRRLGHWDGLKTRISIVKYRRGSTAVWRYLYEYYENENVRTVNHWSK